MIFAIYGCPTTSLPTIVNIVAFVESAVETIFAIVMTVECVSIHCYLMITIARLANTCPIALSAKRTCSVQEMPPMKCPVDMQFIGTASRNLHPMILDVLFVRKLLKRRNTWHRRGRPWLWELHCNLSLLKWHVL